MARLVCRLLNSANLIGLALAALLAASLPAGAAEAPPIAGLDLSAETIEYAPDTITASGQVNLKLEGLEAQGEELRANLGTHMVLMPGPVTLTTSSGVVTGESLAYSWDERRGSLAKVDTTTQGIRLTGQEADISEDALVLNGGLFTKCLLPTPEYAFLARQVEVDSEKSIVKASGVTLALWGHRVLPLPNLRFSLKDTPVGRMSRERLPIPTTGFDSTRGFYVAEEVPFYLSDEAIGLVGAGYGTKEGGRLTLSGLYTPSPATSYRLDARYRQHAAKEQTAGGDVPGSDLDGVFEFTTPTSFGRLTAGYEEAVDGDTGKDLSYLPRVDLAPPSFRAAGLSVTPSLQVAQIKEQASGQASHRAQAQISWSAAPKLPAPLSLGLAGTVRQAWYGTGTTLTAGTLGATLGYPVSGGVAAEIRLNSSQVTGATPFSFDRPDRYTEGETALTWRKSANYASVSAVWDLAGLGSGSGESSAVGKPAAAKASAALQSGPWDVNLQARYELGSAPYFSTLNLALTRRFHCFDVGLSVDRVNETYSLRFTVF